MYCKRLMKLVVRRSRRGGGSVADLRFAGLCVSDVFVVVLFVLAVCVAGCGGPDRTDLASNEPPPAWTDAELTEVRDGERTTLSGARSTVTDDDLARLAGLDKLERLTLDEVKITDAGLAHLAGLTGLKALHVTDQTPGHSIIGDAGIKSLAGLSNLEELLLPSPGATDAAADSLAKLEKLRMLNLGATEMTDEGVERLAALANLEFLRLGGAKLTDESLRHVAKLTKLRQLLLHDAPFTDAGIEHLLALEKIESLYIDRTKVTEEGLSKIAEQKPDWHHIHLDDAHVGGAHGHDH